MALSSSPVKVVPLSTGESPRQSPHDSSSCITKRSFFCGVVVEGSDSGRVLPDEIQDLILSFGDPIENQQETNVLQPTADSERGQRGRALTDTSALAENIKELVATEQSYVQRLRTLKYSYADPLRSFARDKNKALLPPYEAKTLFGNIDNLLPVNEAFFKDLEKMMASNGTRTVGGVGDVALKHFKVLRGFEQYRQYYVKREEAQAIFEREVSKKSSQFCAYIERIKYDPADGNTRNRVGLRELLMDPVQRIPRYTLLFRSMIKHMAPDDPQRAKLIEADQIASNIAQAEVNEETKRAAIFYCLSTSIDGFPPDLFSNSRRFIDCIDVEDVLSDGPSSVTASSTSISGMSLNCTIFLFDDKLLFVKRPPDKSGRTLAGLDEVDRVTKSAGLPNAKRKSGMTAKGVVDLVDVALTDVGGADMNMYLEVSPWDQSDRWSGRPMRILTVVHPPMPGNLDPTRTEADKTRFINNFWLAQGKYRARSGQSVVLEAPAMEVESRGGRVTIARTYYNVFTRTAFLQETKKTKAVVHIDPLGSADNIPFGMGGPPLVVIRVQPMAGDLCRYKVTSSNEYRYSASDDIEVDEEDIVQIGRVPYRIVQTIHQFGLFEFKTGNESRPSTPTAKSKSALFGLDAISRRLNVHARPGTAMGDFFGGSINGKGSRNGRKRAKSTGSQSKFGSQGRSTASRSSLYTQTTQTTSTGDGSMRFSRSNSTATTATSIDDEASYNKRRGKSSVNGERDGPSRCSSRAGSRSQSRERDEEDTCMVIDDDGAAPSRSLRDMPQMNESEYDLQRNLELARRNSKNQHNRPMPKLPIESPSGAIIYEEDLPLPVRPSSQASWVSHETGAAHSDVSHADSEATVTNVRHGRSLHSSDRRPRGPRTPSPLPPSRPASQLSAQTPNSEEESDPRCMYHHTRSHTTPELPSMDEDLALENAAAVAKQQAKALNRHSSVPAGTGIPRSKRLPLFPSDNRNSTPKPLVGASSLPTSILNAPSVEPLSIKKKSSTSSSSIPTTSSIPPALPSTPIGTTLKRNRDSLLHHRSTKSSPSVARASTPITSSLTSTSSQSPTRRTELLKSGSSDVAEGSRLVQLALSTKEHVESAGRAVKRIKLEVDQLRSVPIPDSPFGNFPRSASPDKGYHTPQRPPSTPLTKAAQDRMEEMRQLIGQREGVTPRGHRLTSSHSASSIDSEGHKRAIERLVSDVERDLERASSSQDALSHDVQQLVTELERQRATLEKTRNELQNSKRQCELVKSLLEDATAEKEIMYEAFNEELDGMFNDANLPEDEAWTAMTADLQATKEARNNLSKENSTLKRRLAELQMQQEEWSVLLRAHGLIP
ncbi:hypothetical protein FISHEDRAFT_41844 [Fistulina hepatica ATCC 64428]|nr:hypothetical protein FISHEDRAFT_41844 [Fistulina hepatica ATCC 64428]